MTNYMVLILSIVIMISPSTSIADDDYDDAIIYTCNKLNFESFRIEIYRGAIASSVKYDQYPGARHFHTALQNALKEGINFAGRYSVAVWGCGANCVGMGIVDAISGEVVFYSGIGLAYSNLVKSEESYGVPLGVFFVADSKLLIINPTCETDKVVLEEKRHLAFGDGAPRFYLWTTNGFLRTEQ